MDDEKELEKKAKDNYKQWMEYMDKINKACKQTGITLEQGIAFLDNLYINDHVMEE